MNPLMPIISKTTDQIFELLETGIEGVQRLKREELVRKHYVRTIAEMAYRHAWGKSGTPELRDEWRAVMKRLGVGQLGYDGNKFEWRDEVPPC
jgi:hypothetical protein